jgi:predicted CXXCH cytochrome family protein
MKKTMICTAAFAFLFSLGMAGVSLATDPGPAEMTLKTEAGKKPAVFPHKKHQEMTDCDTCHKAANFPAGAWTMKAGHDFCKECHKTGINGKTGPNKCGDCHK